MVEVKLQELRFGAVRIACCALIIAMVSACAAGQRACCDGVSSNAEQDAGRASVKTQPPSNEKPEGKGQRGTEREPYSFDVGCDTDVDKSASAMEQLAQIGTMCAGGYVSLPIDQRRLKLQRGDCVRAAVTSSQQEQVVSLQLVRSEAVPDEATTSTNDKKTNQVIIERRAVAPFVAPQQGPICVDESGDYVLTATPTDAAATLHTMLWTAQPAASASELPQNTSR